MHTNTNTNTNTNTKELFNINTKELFNISNLDMSIYVFFKERKNEDEIKYFLNELLKRKYNISTYIFKKSTWQKLINTWKISNEDFFKLLFWYLENISNIEKDHLEQLRKWFILIENEKFANIINTILSKEAIKKIWIKNLEIIENKVKNKDQSEKILFFLEKNPEYIKSIILLLTAIKDIDIVLRLINWIKDFKNILKLLDDSYNFKCLENWEILSENITDVYNIIFILENVASLDLLIIFINHIKVNNLIKIINRLWPDKMVIIINRLNHLTDLKSIEDFIEKFNKDDISKDIDKLI